MQQGKKRKRKWENGVMTLTAALGREREGEGER